MKPIGSTGLAPAMPHRAIRWGAERPHARRSLGLCWLRLGALVLVVAACLASWALIIRAVGRLLA